MESDNSLSKLIEEARALLADATPAPWYVWIPGEDTAEEEVVVHGGPRNAIICRTDDVDDEDKDNANLIACAPGLITSLADQLQEQVDLNRTQVESIVEFQREQKLLRDALRDTAIKAHIGFRHEGAWEECGWIECEERRRLLDGAITPKGETNK